MLIDFTEAEYTAAIDAARSAAIPGDLPTWAEPLPTIAALALELANADAEHAALIAEGIDWEKSGEPEAWACQPPCEACHDRWAACGLCGGGGYGDAQ